MTADQRTQILKIAAGACVSLLLLNWIVIGPAADRWGEQSTRIDALEKKVKRGRQLMAAETRIRGQWKSMQRANLPPDDSTAENQAITAMSRWIHDSGISPTSLAYQRQTREDEGYDAFEYRATATGDQVSIGRFLYELSVDPMPCGLEEYELLTRDAHGQQLTLSARFSFVRIAPDSSTGNPGRSTTYNDSRSRGNAE